MIIMTYPPDPSHKRHSPALPRSRGSKYPTPLLSHQTHYYSDEERTDSHTLSPEHTVLTTPVYTSLNREVYLQILMGCFFIWSLHYEVDDLQNSLHRTNHTMTENERMLSNYRIANTRQSRRMDEVRSLTLAGYG